MEEGVWCLAAIQVRNSKTEVSDCLKNILISINQLNYEVPEKSHDTKKLLDYNYFSLIVW